MAVAGDPGLRDERADARRRPAAPGRSRTGAHCAVGKPVGMVADLDPGRPSAAPAEAVQHAAHQALERRLGRLQGLRSRSRCLQPTSSGQLVGALPTAARHPGGSRRSGPAARGGGGPGVAGCGRPPPRRCRPGLDEDLVDDADAAAAGVIHGGPFGEGGERDAWPEVHGLRGTRPRSPGARPDCARSRHRTAVVHPLPRPRQPGRRRRRRPCRGRRPVYRMMGMSARADSATPLPETPDRDGAYPRLDDEQIARSRRGPRAADDDGRDPVPRGRRALRLLRRPGRQGGRRQGERRRRAADRRPRPGAVPRRAGPAHRPGRVLHRGGARGRRGARRAGGRGCASWSPQDPALGDLILRAYLIRRELLIGLGAGFRIIGSRYSPDTRAAARVRGAQPAAAPLDRPRGGRGRPRRCCGELGVAPEETPVVIWRGRGAAQPDATPSWRARSGCPLPGAATARCDLVVVGAGPAGLAAAVYGASEGLRDRRRSTPSRPAARRRTSSRIENYLGFPAGISGAELAERAAIQAEQVRRADHACPARGGRAGRARRRTTWSACGDGRHGARARPGHRHRRPLPQARRAAARGVRGRRASTTRRPRSRRSCARGDPVVVVGGGNSAGQAALFLAEHAAEVRLVVRERRPRRATCRATWSTGSSAIRSIEVTAAHRGARAGRRATRWRRVVVEDNAHRRAAHDSTRARCSSSSAPSRTPAGWPAPSRSTTAATSSPARDAAGRADGAPTAAEPPTCWRRAGPGVFAAGDVRSGSIKRVASAVGEGAMAVRLVHEHLGTLR